MLQRYQLAALFQLSLDLLFLWPFLHQFQLLIIQTDVQCFFAWQTKGDLNAASDYATCALYDILTTPTYINLSYPQINFFTK